MGPLSNEVLCAYPSRFSHWRRVSVFVVLAHSTLSLTDYRPTGGATLTKPSSWDNGDLSVYFNRQASFTPRSATRIVPTGTADPSNNNPSKKTNVGAIAGGVVGGLAVLILILLLVLFCLHRRKKAIKATGEKDRSPPPAPVELAATSPRQELASPGAIKYMSLQQQPEVNSHPAYSGSNSIHSRSPSDDHLHPGLVSPYQPQQYPSTSPTTANYPSPYNTEPPLPTYAHQDHYAYNNQQSHAYDTQNHDPNAYPLPQGASLQREYSYPTPTSPTHPHAFLPVTQYQQPPQFQPPPHPHQVYYPPPPDPSTRSRSHQSHQSSTSYPDRMASPEGTQFSGADRHTGTRSPPSTTQTPAQFYAQPVPSRAQGGLSPPNAFGDEGGSWTDGGSVRSIDSRKRPVRGRFVEVDDL